MLPQAKHTLDIRMSVKDCQTLMEESDLQKVFIIAMEKVSNFEPHATECNNTTPLI